MVKKPIVPPVSISGDELARLLRIVAVGAAVKDAELTAAKRALPAGTSHEVEVTHKIRATVQVGQPTPASTYTIQPACHLRHAAIFVEVLRRLDVTPRQLKEKLRAIVRAGVDRDYDAAPGNQELINAFNQVESEAAGTMTPGIGRSPGRAAPVSVQVISQEILSGAAA